MREAALPRVLAQQKLASVLSFFCLGASGWPCCLLFSWDFLIFELSLLAIQLELHLFLLLSLSLASDSLEMNCIFRHSNSIIEIAIMGICSRIDVLMGNIKIVEVIVFFIVWE